jgi:glucose/arabinose dehydrogenase
MKKHLMACCAILAVSTANMTFAQRGLPSKQPTTASVSTFYPQHVDFKESMVSNLTVPAGFKITVAATGLGKPRMMALSDAGALYITRRDVGDVLMLKDTDGDGRFDELKTIMAQFNGVHGITIRNGYIYLCSDKILKKARLMPDGMLTDTMTLFTNLPDGGQHPNRVLNFGPDGYLYISIGSTCNDCSETNPENATIVRVSADETSRSIYARGLRNTIGFDWHPQTREMWGVDNGTDWRGNDFPHEELNRIKDSAVYGWPQVFDKQQVDETREDPPGTTKAAFAKMTEPAVMLFPAHSAPIDFRFLTLAKSFPADYQDDALVCWHGSWNKAKPDGYKIQRIQFSNGQPTGAVDFFSGFLSKDGKTRFGRPAGLAISPKGIVYISDDESGVIYAVSMAK